MNAWKGEWIYENKYPIINEFNFWRRKVFKFFFNTALLMVLLVLIGAIFTAIIVRNEVKKTEEKSVVSRQQNSPIKPAAEVSTTAKQSPAAASKPIIKKHEVKLVPTCIFKNKDGNIIRKTEGMIQPRILENYMKEQLNG